MFTLGLNLTLRQPQIGKNILTSSQFKHICLNKRQMWRQKQYLSTATKGVIAIKSNQGAIPKAALKRDHRFNRTEAQLPKNIKVIACLGKPIIGASSTQSLKNGWREA
jgi:hypothetical protein